MHVIKTYGVVDVQVHPFLTLTLDGRHSLSSLLRLANPPTITHLPPRKNNTRLPLERHLGKPHGPSGRSGEENNSLPLPGNERRLLGHRNRSILSAFYFGSDRGGVKNVLQFLMSSPQARNAVSPTRWPTVRVDWVCSSLASLRTEQSGVLFPTQAIYFQTEQVTRKQYHTGYGAYCHEKYFTQDYVMYSHLDGHKRKREPPVIYTVIKNARQKTIENTDFN